MDDVVHNQYEPTSVTPPGETLQETIESLGMSQAELAERTGRPKKTINEIIRGKAAITPETALQLQRVLGVPASFWNARERFYREFLARQEDTAQLEPHLRWLKGFPIKWMVKFGWIDDEKQPIQQLRNLLSFFGVASPDQWFDIWRETDGLYRKAKNHSARLEYLSVWLRRGELMARQIDCPDYDQAKLREVLHDIRSLTMSGSSAFEGDLVMLCKSAGVAVVFVRELPALGVSGVTTWLNPNKALIQLSLRYKTTDQLWFTFFHEAGHLLLHGKRETFLEFKGNTDSKEAEADRFAANFLIPFTEYSAFTSAGIWNKTSIARFAQEIGIAPGIVVGRLQHDGYLPHSHCNDLKRRLRWTEGA